MDKNNEVEYKTLVSQDQFERLRAHFENRLLIDQTNIYFDTPDRQLFHQHVSCRIRIVNGLYEATVKTNVGGSLLEHTLLTDGIDPIIFDHPDYKILWDSLKIQGELLPVGQCHTIREMVNDGMGELCFDTNTYGNTTDYEIEYEVKDRFESGFERFEEILALENIPYLPSASKMMRATHPADFQ